MYQACSANPVGPPASEVPSWEHFAHDADISVRGWGATAADAFGQAAFAVTAVVTDPAAVRLTDLFAQVSSTEWRMGRQIVEEAPGAHKDVALVVDAAQAAGLARKVARLEPMICIKG
jgi:RNA-splicing ligase RtcB